MYPASCVCHRYGADAVLLIAAVLPNKDLDLMVKVSQKLGLQCLIEVGRRTNVCFRCCPCCCSADRRTRSPTMIPLLCPHVHVCALARRQGAVACLQSFHATVQCACCWVWRKSM